MLAEADFLIPDEPGNSLDQPNRQVLIEQLLHWPHDAAYYLLLTIRSVSR